MIVEARAKINWTLEILGQRPDGYHLLDMLMQPITLADRILLTPADSLSLETEGPIPQPAGEDNLALRAALRLKEATGYAGGAAIRLEKHIPTQAGLGGGSADAAGVLAGLNQLWQTGLSGEQLEEIGLGLGADVPFCIRGGLCRVRGIGESLTAMPSAPAWPLIVLQPCGGLSTGEVFRAWHARGREQPVHTEETLKALLSGSPTALPAHPGNDLETVSFALEPILAEACRALRETGAICAQMSGSGSAVFGVYPDRAARDRACPVIQAAWPGAVCCDTCAESLVLDSNPCAFSHEL